LKQLKYRLVHAIFLDDKLSLNIGTPAVDDRRKLKEETGKDINEY